MTRPDIDAIRARVGDVRRNLNYSTLSRSRRIVCESSAADVPELLSYIEQLEGSAKVIDSLYRQIEARTGETAGERLLKAKCMELEAQIERVRGLHKPEHLHNTPLCVECSDFGTDDHPAGALIEYPCPTIKALDAPKGICDHGCESLTGLCIVDHKSLGGRR